MRGLLYVAVNELGQDAKDHKPSSTDSKSVLDVCSVTLSVIGECLSRMNATLATGMRINAFDPQGVRAFLNEDVCPRLVHNYLLSRFETRGNFN